jgi:hypothetical protein
MRLSTPHCLRNSVASIAPELLPQIELVIAMLDLLSLAMTISVHCAEHFGSYCKPLRLARRHSNPAQTC